jgi:LemA protein
VLVRNVGCNQPNYILSKEKYYMKKQAQILFIWLMVIIVTSIFLTIYYYNAMVNAAKAVEAGQAQIATVCQRRHDLIPNLIATVKGSAKHERKTLEAVVLARSQAQHALTQVQSKGANGSSSKIKQMAVTQRALSESIKGVFILVEKYPTLQSLSNFTALQDQLEGTENRISVARQRYNQKVRIYNAEIVAFPGIFLAPMFGFHKKEFYKAQEEVFRPIKVQF